MKKETKSLPERRSMPVCELRAETVSDSDLKTITGYAAIFNQEADIGGMFREVIRSGAFSRAIEERQDVRALWNHNPDTILGRTVADTLSLNEDERGLKITIDPPDTSAGRDMVESINRGDVTTMSFAFAARTETWTEEDGKLPLRELVDVDLFDVSPVTYPAYSGTSVGLRSAEDIYKQHLDSVGQEPSTEDTDADGSKDRDMKRRRLELAEIENK